MRHFCYVEEQTGEQFIVGTEDYEDSWEAAWEVCQQIEKEYGGPVELKFQMEMTDEEAEASGLDEY